MAALVGMVIATMALTSQAPSGGAYGEPEKLSKLKDDRINESSGLARSWERADAFWTHNDSGDAPRLYCIDVQGKTIADVEVRGADAEDWEDICSFRRQGVNYLLIGDVGNNSKRREALSLYFVVEPDVTAAGDPGRRQTELAGILRFRLEGNPQDCESVAVDVQRGVILLVSKQFGSCTVYELPLTANREAVLTARRVGRIPVPAVTGIDVSADSRRLVVLSYADAFEFERTAGESWTTALKGAMRRIALPFRRQGEAICYGQDDRSLYLTSEGRDQLFWKIPFTRD